MIPFSSDLCYPRIFSHFPPFSLSSFSGGVYRGLSLCPGRQYVHSTAASQPASASLPLLQSQSIIRSTYDWVWAWLFPPLAACRCYCSPDKWIPRRDLLFWAIPPSLCFLISLGQSPRRHRPVVPRFATRSHERSANLEKKEEDFAAISRGGENNEVVMCVVHFYYIYIYIFSV